MITKRGKIENCRYNGLVIRVNVYYTHAAVEFV